MDLNLKDLTLFSCFLIIFFCREIFNTIYFFIPIFHFLHFLGFLMSIYIGGSKRLIQGFKISFCYF